MAAWRFVDVAAEPRTPLVGDLFTLAFTVLDEGGEPVSGLSVVAALREPVRAYNQPQPPPAVVVRGEARERPGRYLLRIPLNAAGRWWIDVTVESPDGQRRTFSRFVEVAARYRVPPVEGRALVFFAGQRWQTFYRVDASTGLTWLLGGEDVVRAGDRWLLIERRTTPLTRVTQVYGGRWSLSLLATDAQTGERVVSVGLGEVRAAVQGGSSTAPALVSAVTVDPTGEHLYVYWSRQLGQGWYADLATVSLATGTVVTEQHLPGALLGDRVVPQLAVSPDGGALVVAEQVVRVAAGSGYRLSVLRAGDLEVEATHRAPGELMMPWVGCPMTYPGTSGLAGGAVLRWFALCTSDAGTALFLWDPREGRVTHQVDLSELAPGGPALAFGGHVAYAVASWPPEAVEIDLLTGEVRRARSRTAGEQSPSPIERIIRWLVGAVVADARAAPQASRWVGVDPEAGRLYVVAPVVGSEGFGDGIWVIDTRSLTVVDRWLEGRPLVAVTVAGDGTVVAVERAGDGPDRALILDADGRVALSVALPEAIGGTVVSR